MQAPGGQSVPKLQTVGDQAPHTQMLGQGTEEMVQFPADQHHLIAVGAQPPYGLNPLGLEMVSQLVLEIFFTQQVQAVPAGAPQRQVDQSGGQPRIPDTHDQMDGTHQTNAQQAVDSARKRLGVAGVVGSQSRGVDPEQPTVGTHEGKLSRLVNGVLQRIAVFRPGDMIQGSRSALDGKTILSWAGRFPDSEGRPGRHRQSERIREHQGFFKPKRAPCRRWASRGRWAGSEFQGPFPP